MAIYEKLIFDFLTGGKCSPEHCASKCVGAVLKTAGQTLEVAELQSELYHLSHTFLLVSQEEGSAVNYMQIAQMSMTSENL